MKKWKGITIREIHMGVFDFSVFVVVGNYETACSYALWKFDDKETSLEEAKKGYTARGMCFFRRGYVPIVWIPKKPQSSREHATLAHECLHAVFHLFEWANLPITRDTEEVMTHAMAHLIANAL